MPGQTKGSISVWAIISNAPLPVLVAKTGCISNAPQAAMICIVILISILLPFSTVAAKEGYQSPQAFIKEVFANSPPKPSLLWLTKETQQQAKAILGHKLPMLRLRYWRQDNRSAWVLEEVGKEKPITAGIVIEAGKIGRFKVLAFRESRGWEVRYPFFTDQFVGAALVDRFQLSQSIDGISGATLSVRALKKLARLALYFDQLIKAGDVAS